MCLHSKDGTQTDYVDQLKKAADDLAVANNTIGSLESTSKAEAEFSRIQLSEQGQQILTLVT